MKVNRNGLLIIPVIITIIACIYWLSSNKDDVIETITFFPLDEKAVFLDTKTEILSPQVKNNQIILPITTFSRLNEPAYLRQDIALVFANGRLVKKLSIWKENIDQLKLADEVRMNNNQLIQVISYHYSELHRDNEEIKSTQALSDDKLYLLTKEKNSVITFRQPHNEEEIQWKEKLDSDEHKLLQSTIEKAANKYNFKLNFYDIIPLYEISSYANRPLPGFSQKQTSEIIGKLWEGIYKNYVVGIRKNDGEIVSPIGSTIPIILLAKDRSHVFVIFETETNEVYLLKQLISKKSLID